MTDKPNSDDPSVAAGDEPPEPGVLELVVALEPTTDEQAAASDDPAAAHDARVEAVARFIAVLAPADLSDSLEEVQEDDDSPTLAYSALRPVGKDAERPRPRSIPPALPAAVTGMLPPPRPAELPNVLLGEPLSMRGDPTERIETIPKTHPLANSIAPGGSAISMPPRVPGTRRLTIALAAVILLGLGTGASLLLQSRGENHAASLAARPRESQALERAPSQESERLPPEQMRAPDEQPTSIVDDPAAQEPDAASDAARGEAAPEGGPGAVVVAYEPVLMADDALSARATTALATAQPLSVAMGTARFQPGDVRPLSSAVARDRVISALARYHDRVRTCVGDAHGIADVVLTVRGSGFVSHALVEGAFSGSPAGSCIARTLRSARLPRFPEPSVKIIYPFQL